MRHMHERWENRVCCIIRCSCRAASHPPQGFLPFLDDLLIGDPPLGGTLPAIGKHNTDPVTDSSHLGMWLYNLGLTGYASLLIHACLFQI